MDNKHNKDLTLPLMKLVEIHGAVKVQECLFNILLKVPAQPSDPLGAALALDTNTANVARAVHRIVRAMHDGECPRCHKLFDSRPMIGHAEIRVPSLYHRCPNCGFEITSREVEAAIKFFGPIMEKNLEVFEGWRTTIGVEAEEPDKPSRQTVTCHWCGETGVEVLCLGEEKFYDSHGHNKDKDRVCEWGVRLIPPFVFESGSGLVQEVIDEAAGPPRNVKCPVCDDRKYIQDGCFGSKPCPNCNAGLESLA